MKAIFIVGDIGATKDLIPAARELKKLSCKVTWSVDPAGKGHNLLSAENIPYGERDASLEAGNYDVIVIGTSATAVEEQIEWTKQGKKAGTPVIWYEDLWGTGQRPATRSVNPDVMLTVGKTASGIARHVRPNIQVQAVGKPSFEEITYYHSRIDETRERIRGELGIKNDDIVVLYWGGGEQDRVKLHLEALMGIEEVYSRRVIHLPRLHPKMPGRDEAWSHLQTLSNIIDAHDVDEVSLNCAADVVMGEFGSTQTYVAAMLGTHPIIALWPDNLKKREACGFVKGVPPQIENRVAAGVRSREDIMNCLFMWVTNANRQVLRHRALQIFGDAIQPGAAKRIAEAIVKYAK